MAKLPEPQNTTVQAIYRWHESRADSGFRPHLGASLIGTSCERALWYTFRWVTLAAHSGRLLRLFETGQLAEHRFIAELRGIGAEAFAFDPTTGRQFTVSALGGHFGGSMDGCARGLVEAPERWHVLEFKTHSAKSFKELAPTGVHAAKPLHYAQMQIYMGLTGMERAFYLAVNKDTDELYGERVKFDQAEFLRLTARAERVIRANEPPEKISQDPAWFECKFCSHYSTCQALQAPAVNCRTCIHSTPVVDESDTARWTCARHERDIGPELQRQSCDQHIYIPALLAQFAEAVDAGSNYVEYRNKLTGAAFFNGEDPAVHYSSQEIHDCEDKRALGDAGVDQVRQAFDARLSG